jgi:nicotinate-nucleotide adenylyltransferase
VLPPRDDIRVSTTTDTVPPVPIRIGVFGGTFDPVHNGHLLAAVAVRHALGLDELVVVPAGDPWQKQGAVVAGADDRLAMLGAAFDGVADTRVDRIEIDRAGPTYTADTLEALTAPDRELLLVLGADAARRIHTWRRVDAIQRLASLVIVNREGDDAGATPGDGWRVEHVTIPRLDISSTDLRRRFACGEPVDGLMPVGAIRVARERRLYTRLG